jgi:hypothetical protein
MECGGLRLLLLPYINYDFSEESKVFWFRLQLAEKINEQPLHIITPHIYAFAGAVLAAVIGIESIPPFRPTGSQRTVTPSASNKIAKREIRVVALAWLHRCPFAIEQSLHSIERLATHQRGRVARLAYAPRTYFEDASVNRLTE